MFHQGSKWSLFSWPPTVGGLGYFQGCARCGSEPFRTHQMNTSLADFSLGRLPLSPAVLSAFQGSCPTPCSPLCLTLHIPTWTSIIVGVSSLHRTLGWPRREGRTPARLWGTPGPQREKGGAITSIFKMVVLPDMGAVVEQVVGV